MNRIAKIFLIIVLSLAFNQNALSTEPTTNQVHPLEIVIQVTDMTAAPALIATVTKLTWKQRSIPALLTGTGSILAICISVYNCTSMQTIDWREYVDLTSHIFWMASAIAMIRINYITR